MENLEKNTVIADFARSVIRAEYTAIQQLTSYIDDDFLAVAELIFTLKGRVVISGIGKSAIIAQKLVATFNSTGTPSVFLHAADAIHGDLGIIQPGDLVICISKSGNSPEIQTLIPIIKKMGNIVVAMVGNKGSVLDNLAHYSLNTTVEREACPNNLAPTTSTTAQLVMGDALAMVLVKMRNFTSEDFSKYHPGGALGKKLYTSVEELMTASKPAVDADDDLEKIVLEISGGRLGAAAVLENNKVIGVITDGDLRRMLQNRRVLNKVRARDIMTPNPKSIEPSALAIKAHTIMEQYKITNLIVIENEEYKGIIHLHDIHRGGVI